MGVTLLSLFRIHLTETFSFKVDNTYGDTMKVIQKLFRIDAFDSDEIKVLATK